MEADIQMLESRLIAIEQAHLRLRRIAVLSVVVIAGIALLIVQFAQNRTPRILEAERFILKDAKGEMRGGILMTPDGPSLQLFDSNHTLRLLLSVSGNQPNLTLKDANGIGVLIVADVPTGPGMMLYDRSGNPRAQFDVGSAGPRLYLEDAQGFSTTIGNYFTGNPATDQKLNAASVILGSKSLGAFWRAP